LDTTAEKIAEGIQCPRRIPNFAGCMNILYTTCKFVVKANTAHESKEHPLLSLLTPTSPIVFAVMFLVFTIGQSSGRKTKRMPLLGNFLNCKYISQLSAKFDF
jgi:hypothetical protein